MGKDELQSLITRASQNSGIPVIRWTDLPAGRPIRAWVPVIYLADTTAAAKARVIFKRTVREFGFQIQLLGGVK